jgi:hypothetical protein
MQSNGKMNLKKSSLKEKWNLQEKLEQTSSHTKTDATGATKTS